MDTKNKCTLPQYSVTGLHIGFSWPTDVDLFRQLTWRQKIKAQQNWNSLSQVTEKRAAEHWDGKQGFNLSEGSVPSQVSEVLFHCPGLHTFISSYFQKGPTSLQLQKFLHSQKVIVHTRHFSFSWRAGCAWKEKLEHLLWVKRDSNKFSQSYNNIYKTPFCELQGSK